MKKIVIDLNCSETNYEEFLQGVEDFLKNNTEFYTEFFDAGDKKKCIFFIY